MLLYVFFPRFCGPASQLTLILGSGIIAPMNVLSTRRALRRGQLLAKSGRVDEALSTFASAIEEDAQLLVHHALTLARAGRMNEALEKSARAAGLGDEGTARFHAYLLLRAGKAREGETALKKAQALAPSHPLVLTLTAALELIEGRAVEACKKLLAGPVSDNLELLGWILALVEERIYQKQGPDSDVLPPEPQSKVPDEPLEVPTRLSNRAATRKGSNALEAGRPKTAMKFLEHATTLKPDDTDARALLGAALFEAHDFERAEATLALVPCDAPLGGVAQFYRAANAWRLGKNELALELVDSLPERGDVVLYRDWFDLIRGLALAALGRTDEAANKLASFINTEPGFFEKRLKKAMEVFGERG